MSRLERLEPEAPRWSFIQWLGFVALVVVQFVLGLAVVFFSAPFEPVCLGPLTAEQLSTQRLSIGLLVVVLVAFWSVWLAKMPFRRRSIVAAVVVLLVPVYNLILVFLASPHAAPPCNF